MFEKRSESGEEVEMVQREERRKSNPLSENYFRKEELSLKGG